MNNYMQEFVDSAESHNTQKVYRFVFNKIGDKSIENYNLIQLEQLILDTHPNSNKEITTIIYVLSSYAKWLQEKKLVNNDNLYQIVQSIDKRLLWEMAKPQARKKFISHEQFEDIVHEISVYEDFNALYYETLFRSIYEGIYNDDLSVLKNLRGSDVKDNIVTLREDNNHIYELKISERLAKDLKYLATVNTWQRRNRFGVCNIDMRGLHSDSVFKIEDRITAANDSYKFSYYSRLRKIAKEYLEYTLLPLQLYASGIMHRIKVELDKSGMSLEEAFVDNNRNKMAHLIIQKELLRCNSSIEIGNFRELVKGHLESF